MLLTEFLFFRDASFLISPLLSMTAVAISVVSLLFTLRNWRQSNRPLLTVKVTSFNSGGNIAIPLSILVENTGNRPAKNIRLSVVKEDLINALTSNATFGHKEANRCFSKEGMIPVLANGKSVSNGFGLLSEDEQCTWKHHSVFNVTLSYEDIDGARFKHIIPLKIADDSGFADSHWTKS